MSNIARGVGFFEVDHDQLFYDIIDAYYLQEPLYIWGRTGIGKSFTVRKAAEHLAKEMNRGFSERVQDIDDRHFVLVDRRLSMMDPTDLLGVLFKENGVSNWHPPKWLYMLSKQREEKEGIEIKALLFLDEINLAPELTQNASYQLILDRRVGDIELADGVSIIAAGNVSEDRAFTFDLPDPLRTRFTHVTLRPPVFRDEGRKRGWYYWAIENGIDGRVLAFLEFKPDLLFKYDEDDRTFPTPRGWEKASKLMRGKPNRVAWRAVAKACGYSAGLQFREFMALSEEVDIDDILANPEKFMKMRFDVQLSVVANLSQLIRDELKDRIDEVINLVAVIGTGLKLEKLDELSEAVARVGGGGYRKKAELIREFIKTHSAERRPEMAATIISSLKNHNREELRGALKRSKYGPVLFELLKFTIGHME